MKINKTLFLFIFFAIFLIFIFPNNSYAGHYLNYDVSTLTSDEIDYIKKCSDNVVKYCNENNISFEEYPLYYILHKTENFSFSDVGNTFYIFIADSDSHFFYLGNTTGYGFNNGNRYSFEFNTGSTDFVQEPFLASFSDWRYGFRSLNTQVFYTNYTAGSPSIIVPNNDIDFYTVSEETPVEPEEPIEPEVPVEPDIPEVPDEPDIPEDTENTRKLVKAYRGISFDKVLQEILDILPILLLVLIAYIGLRKAINFYNKIYCFS